MSIVSPQPSRLTVAVGGATSEDPHDVSSWYDVTLGSASAGNVTDSEPALPECDDSAMRRSSSGWTVTKLSTTCEPGFWVSGTTAVTKPPGASAARVAPLASVCVDATTLESAFWNTTAAPA